MIFADLIKQDGALARACELAYEFYMKGKCWHCKFEDGERAKGLVWCTKCGHNLGSEFGINPSLAKSLDAWAEHMWPVMGGAIMGPMMGGRTSNFDLLDPMWWLEKALRSAEVECDRCGGMLIASTHSCKNCTCGEDGITCMEACPCTCTNGRISLYQQLEREVGGCR